MDSFSTLTIWLCAVAARVLACVLEEGSPNVRGILHIASFAFFTGVLLGLALCTLNVCGALSGVIDVFCISVVEKPRILGAIHEWNVLQAVLRKGSNAIEFTIFTLQVVVVAMVLLGVIDFTEGQSGPVALVPAILIAAVLGRAFLRAGGVTDKCARVPALVNSLVFGVDMDLQRQYVVDYILRSDAGFYVFELRLTSAMVLKFAYVCGVAVFALVTKEFQLE